MEGMLNLPRKAAVGAATLVAVLGAGGTAWAVESSATPHPGILAASGSTSSTSTPAATPRGKGRAGSLLDRADHGTLEVRTKTGWETVDYDRGKVIASSASSITLMRPDGHSVIEAVTSTTKYHGPGTIAVAGQPARVISSNGNALNISQGTGRAHPGPGSGASASAHA